MTALDQRADRTPERIPFPVVDEVARHHGKERAGITAVDQLADRTPERIPFRKPQAHADTTGRGEPT